MYHVSNYPTEFLAAAERLDGCPRRIVDERAENPRVHFSMAATERWRVCPADPDDQPWAGDCQLLQVCCAEHPSARIEVTFSRLTRDVSPGDRLDVAVQCANEQVRARRDEHTPFGWWADILSTGSCDEGIRARRSVAVKDGDYLFFVSGSGTAEAYDELADDMFVALSTFRLSQPTGRIVAEETRRLVLGDGRGRVSFVAPASWDVLDVPVSVNEAEGGERMLAALRLVNRVETASGGAVDVAVFDRTKCEPADLLVQYARGLHANGVRTCGAPVVPVKCAATFDEVWQTDLAAQSGTQRFLIPAQVICRSHVAVRIALLGCARFESPELWAINKRAFEIMRDSMQIAPLSTSGPKELAR